MHNSWAKSTTKLREEPFNVHWCTVHRTAVSSAFIWRCFRLIFANFLFSSTKKPFVNHTNFTQWIQVVCVCVCVGLMAKYGAQSFFHQICQSFGMYSLFSAFHWMVPVRVLHNHQPNSSNSTSNEYMNWQSSNRILRFDFIFRRVSAIRSRNTENVCIFISVGKAIMVISLIINIIIILIILLCVDFGRAHSCSKSFIRTHTFSRIRWE